MFKQIVYQGKPLKDVEIFLDDSIAIIRTKLAARLQTEPEHIGMWTMLPTHGAAIDTNHLLIRPVIDLYHKQSKPMTRIKAAWVNEMMQYLVPGSDPIAGRGDSVSLATIGQSIDGHIGTSIAYPIGACWVSSKSSTRIPLPTHPVESDASSWNHRIYEMITQKDDAIMVDVERESLLLEDYINQSQSDPGGQTLHVFLYDDAPKSPALAMTCFPLMMTSGLKMTATLDGAKKHDQEREMLTRTLKPKAKPNFTFSLSRADCSQTLTLFAGASTTELLSIMFENLVATQEVPFIKYHDGDDTRYKIHNAFLGHNDKEHDALIQRWSSKPSITKKIEYIAFHITAATTVVITADLKVQATYTNLQDSVTDLDSRISHTNQHVIPIIHRSLSPIHYAYKSFLPPIHDFMTIEQHATSRFRTNAQHIAYNYYIRFGSDNTLLPVRQIYSRIIESVSTILNPYGVTADDQLIMSYNRSTYSSDRLRLPIVITRLRNDPKEVVIDQLQTIFSIPEDVASTLYDAYMADDTIKYATNIYYKDVIPIISLSSNYTAIVYNVSNAHYMHRICALIQTLIDLVLTNRPSKSDKLSRTAPPESVNPSIIDSIVQETTAIEGDSGHGYGYTDESGSGKDPQSYLLNQLQIADERLFKFPGTTYSTDCPRNTLRQPVVISRQELQAHEDDNNAMDAIVDYGTSEDASKQNAYICPNVWCPKSRKAMSTQQYEDSGRKCPDDDETPIVFENSYFKKGKKRFPGLLDGNKHPDGMCMPCCFVKPAKRLDQCGARLSTPPAEDDLQLPQGSIYVRSDVSIPLAQDRYGILSESFQAYLGTRCGNRPDGSGVFAKGSQCFARKGLKSDKSFLAAAEHVLGLKKMPKGGLKTLLLKKVTMEDFLKLGVSKDYLDNVRLHTDTITKQLIFNQAFDDFKHAFETDPSNGHADGALDLVNMYYTDQAIIIVERDRGDADMHMTCSRHLFRTHDSAKTPIVLIMRYGDFYEPIVHLNDAEQVHLIPEEHPALLKLIEDNRKVCRSDDLVARTLRAIAEMGMTVKAQVITHSLKLVGVTVSGGKNHRKGDDPVYVPIDPSGKQRLSLIPDVGIDLVFAETKDIGAAVSKDAASMFADLAKRTDHAGYEPKTITPKLVTLNNGGKSPLLSIAKKDNEDEEQAFIDAYRYHDRPPAMTYTNRRPMQGHFELVQAYWNDIDLQREINALRSTFYPLPLSDRRDFMKRIVKKYTQGIEADVLTDHMLYNPTPLRVQRLDRIDHPADYRTFNSTSLTAYRLHATQRASRSRRAEMRI